MRFTMMYHFEERVIMADKNYNNEDELTAAVAGCSAIGQACDVITKARKDAGDFAYLNLRHVMTNMDEPFRASLLALFSAADKRFMEFAAPGCDE